MGVHRRSARVTEASEAATTVNAVPGHPQFDPRANEPTRPLWGILRMITSCIMRNYKHPLDALERLDPEWERAVRDLHRTGWRQ